MPSAALGLSGANEPKTGFHPPGSTDRPNVSSCVTFVGYGAETPYSGPIGILLVPSGLLAVVISTLRFFQAREQIDKGRFVPDVFPEVTVVLVTLVGGAALVVYLALSGR